jgi:hypothetical protein
MKHNRLSVIPQYGGAVLQSGLTSKQSWSLEISRLYNSCCFFLNAVMLTVIVLSLGIFVAGLAPRYAKLSVACGGDECPVLALSPEEAAALVIELGTSMTFYAGLQMGVEIFHLMVMLVLAVTIYWHRAADRMGRLVAFALVMLGAILATEGDAALVKLYPSLRLLDDSLTALTMILLASLFFIFPDGYFVPRWTGLLFIGMGAILLGVVLPPAASPRLGPGAVGPALSLLMLGLLILGLFAQIYRYRHVSTLLERQQTKWVVFGLSAVALSMIVWLLNVELFPFPPGPMRLYFNLIGVVVIALLAICFPLSLAIAILRYRLWDIDVLINRAMVYGALTGALAFVYFGSVALLQNFFAAISGQRSDLAVVISTLAIAALFTPLRRRVQTFIDHRFYRHKYDAARTLADFAATARDEVELEQLTDALLAVVQETMLPAHVSLWLREPEWRTA